MKFPYSTNRRVTPELEFDRIVRPHLPLLHRTLQRLTNCTADAEDILQDVLIKLYPKLDELKMLDEPQAWLMRVAYRQFIDHTRRQNRNPVAAQNSVDQDLLHQLPGSTTPEQSLDSDETARQVGLALGELDAERRALVVLNLIEGYTLEEVSSILNQPVGTLKSRLHRLKSVLKKRLAVEPFVELARVSKRG